MTLTWKQGNRSCEWETLFTRTLEISQAKTIVFGVYWRCLQSTKTQTLQRLR